MQVTTTSPAPNGGLQPARPADLQRQLQRAGGVSSVTTGSLVLSGISGATVAGVTLANGNTTAVYTLNVPTVGTLTASIAAGAVTDQYGYPNAAFSASYLVNIGTEAFPVPLARSRLPARWSTAGAPRAWSLRRATPTTSPSAWPPARRSPPWCSRPPGCNRRSRCPLRAGPAGFGRGRRRRRRRPPRDGDCSHLRQLYDHGRGGRLDHRDLYRHALFERGVGGQRLRRGDGQHPRHGPGPHRLVRAARHIGFRRQRGGPGDNRRRHTPEYSRSRPTRPRPTLLA